MYIFNKMVQNNNFHTGFYENGIENIKKELLEIKSSGDSVEILKNSECVYYSAEDFLHGICHIFAYALHQKFGYDILELKSNSGSTVHWCCISNYNGKEIYIDVRGVTSDFDEFLFEFYPEIREDFSKNIIKNLTNYEIELEKNELKFANEIIEKYYNYYLI